jgi:hypothetical protein
MSRIVVAAAAIGVMVATIVAWSNFVIVEPEVAGGAAKAATVQGVPMISPLKMMQTTAQCASSNIEGRQIDHAAGELAWFEMSLCGDKAPRPPSNSTP